jgi:hypothetical protein
MNIQSLFDRLNRFAPPPQQQQQPGPAAPVQARPPQPEPGPADRFGPAANVGLSAEARQMLAAAQSAQAAQAARAAPAAAAPAASGEPADEAALRVHRSVFYPLDDRPSPLQLAKVHEITAQFAHDTRPDAQQRMMDELRRHGLHPEQLEGRRNTGRPGTAARDEAAPARSAGAQAGRPHTAEHRPGTGGFVAAPFALAS